MLAQEIYYGIQRCSWAEDLRYSLLLERWNVGLRDCASENYENVFGLLLLEEREQARNECVVRSAEDAEADAVYVFLDCGVDDGFGGLAESCVEHFHACVAERVGDDFGAAVVSVEAYFGD